jgi:hypothetical protein
MVDLGFKYIADHFINYFRSKPKFLPELPEDLPGEIYTPPDYGTNSRILPRIQNFGVSDKSATLDPKLLCL